MKDETVYFYIDNIKGKSDRYLQYLQKKVDIPSNKVVLNRVSLSNVFERIEERNIIKMITDVSFSLLRREVGLFLLRLNVSNNDDLVSDFCDLVGRESFYANKNHKIIILEMKTKDILENVMRDYVYCYGGTILIAGFDSGKSIVDVMNSLGITNTTRKINNDEAFIKLAYNSDYTISNIDDSMIDILSKKYSTEEIMLYIAKSARKYNITIKEEEQFC